MISVNKYSNKRTYYQITGHKRTMMYRQCNVNVRLEKGIILTEN